MATSSLGRCRCRSLSCRCWSCLAVSVWLSVESVIILDVVVVVGIVMVSVSKCVGCCLSCVWLSWLLLLWLVSLLLLLCWIWLWLCAVAVGDDCDEVLGCPCSPGQSCDPMVRQTSHTGHWHTEQLM